MNSQQKSQVQMKTLCKYMYTVNKVNNIFIKLLRFKIGHLSHKQKPQFVQTLSNYKTIRGRIEPIGLPLTEGTNSQTCNVKAMANYGRK